MIEELDAAMPEIEGKVFPVNAPSTEAHGNIVQAPYVIFNSTPGLKGKSLSGFHSDKTVEIELNIIGKNYPNMKNISGQVIDTIISFEQRRIGTSGPFIQEVSYEMPTEHFEAEPKLYRCNVIFTFYFNEGA